MKLNVNLHKLMHLCSKLWKKTWKIVVGSKIVVEVRWALSLVTVSDSGGEEVNSGLWS